MSPRLLILALFVVISACRQGDQKSAANPQTAPSTMCSGTKADDREWYTSGKKAPLFSGLEGIDFKVSTENSEAQQYFNQGMMLAYGFNHAEAARSFFEVTRLDSMCAMGYWGFAYVLGPNYNAGMEPDNYIRAHQAAQKAMTLASTSPITQKEKDLITALAERYAENAPDDRSSLDAAYSAAMKKVYEKFTEDPDIGAMYAESMMDMHPWDLYDKKTKEPKPWTPEIVQVLEHLMVKNPKHPGAHHLYIHAMEASSHPEKALPSASLFDHLVPGSGHLVHMPSHIYINTGDYHLGSLSNQKAVEVDSIYTTTCHAHGAYPLAYYPHNYHFLAATATLEGNSSLAWKAALKVKEHTAKDLLSEPGWGTLQHYYIIPYYVGVKLAMWDSILAQPPITDEKLVYPRVIEHYARGMAFLGKNDVISAEEELSKLETLSNDTTIQHITIWEVNTAQDLVKIALKVLEGEVALAKQDLIKAESFFAQAIAIEDELNYNEPPDWFFSVRHHLGICLLRAGKLKEAEKIYNEDLKNYKKNGWALAGLEKSLRLQNKTQEADEVKKRFEEAWKYADEKLTALVMK